MRNQLTALAAGMALVCTLSACGGGGGSFNPAAQVVPAKPVLVEEYGDSTVAGCENSCTIYTANSEPHDLQNLLQAQFGSSVTVGNEGVAGTEAWQLLTGNDGKHPAFAQQMAQSKAQIVTFNFALNDSWLVDHPNGPTAPSESPADYQAALTSLIEVARAGGKIPVLVEPNPTINFQNSRVPEYVGYMQAVAAQQNVPIVHNLAEMEELDWQALLSNDGIHPNDAGYLVKAQNELPILALAVQASR